MKTHYKYYIKYIIIGLLIIILTCIFIKVNYKIIEGYSNFDINCNDFTLDYNTSSITISDNSYSDLSNSIDLLVNDISLNLKNQSNVFNNFYKTIECYDEKCRDNSIDPSLYNKTLSTLLSDLNSSILGYKSSLINVKNIMNNTLINNFTNNILNPLNDICMNLIAIKKITNDTDGDYDTDADKFIKKIPVSNKSENNPFNIANSDFLNDYSTLQHLTYEDFIDKSKNLSCNVHNILRPIPISPSSIKVNDCSDNYDLINSSYKDIVNIRTNITTFNNSCNQIINDFDLYITDKIIPKINEIDNSFNKFKHSFDVCVYANNSSDVNEIIATLRSDVNDKSVKIKELYDNIINKIISLINILNHYVIENIELTDHYITEISKIYDHIRIDLIDSRENRNFYLLNNFYNDIITPEIFTIFNKN